MKKSAKKKSSHLPKILLVFALGVAGFIFVTNAFGGAGEKSRGEGPKCGGPDQTCWQRLVDISNPGPSASDYQVKLTLDTADLIKKRQMRSDCGDLRFTDSDGVTPISHWVESGCNSDSTNIWAKVPLLAGAAETTIYANYGNSRLASTSDFNSTFPNSYILRNGLDIASGPQNYDWFEVGEGATLNTQDGNVQEITARKVVIAGTVNGSGRGFDGAAARGSGQGPGAGSYKSGAGYGGAGGQGQGSAWGAGGTPGSVYGDASSQDIQMGSGGGASDNIQAPGGAGGGAVILNAAEVAVSGTITVEGGSHRTGTNQNGGGSGGGILVMADRVHLSGALSASGGSGDNGTVRSGGAGGGGGGRIKIFSDEFISDTSTKNVSGGVGSPGGTNGGSYSPGSDGAPGTIHMGTFISDEPTSVVSSKAKRLAPRADKDDDEKRDDDEDDDNNGEKDDE